MILGLFRRRDPNADIVDRLYAAVAQASRAPALYREGAVPDTVDGRFDLLVIHAFVVLRRLKTLPEPGPDLAQDLVDATFKHLDHALRELGVGDVVVPKRMKTLASAFYGRAKAYEDALGGAEPLEDALLRNVYAKAPERAPQAAALAAYLRASVAAFDAASFETIASATLPFPQPDPFFKGAP